jgi:sensor histidine kinase YesM
MQNHIPIRFSAAIPRLLTLQTYLARLVISIACWSAVTIIEAALVYLIDASHGYYLPTSHYLLWAGLNWYAWALISPLVYALARYYYFTRTNWIERILLPHLLACLVCVMIQAVARGVAAWFYTLHQEIHGPLSELIGSNLTDRGFFGALAYWFIVMVAAFAHLRDQVRQRELRQAQLESRLASAELEMLRMQIHPHFLFNTLQAAITLVQDDPRAAEDVLLRLSELLRISLDQMGTNEVPLARELEFLDLYVGIQRQRFGDRLAVEIHADPSTLNYQVPPLLLQPLVENAILHGIGKHKGEDLIEVFAHLENGGLQLEVWNGNSVVEDASEKLLMRGVGLRNTKARLEQLYGPSASLIIRSLARRGAALLIFIPAKDSRQATVRPAVGAAS